MKGVTRFKRDTEKVPIGGASTRLAAAQVLQPPEPQVGAQAAESNVQKPKTDEQRVTFRPGGIPVPSQPPRWTRLFIPLEPRPYVNLGARPRTLYYQQQYPVSQSPTFQGAAFQQLQPSRTVESTQQCRVLIRSRLDPPPPKFVLNEIPFKAPI